MFSQSVNCGPHFCSIINHGKIINFIWHNTLKRTAVRANYYVRIKCLNYIKLFNYCNFWIYIF